MKYWESELISISKSFTRRIPCVVVVDYVGDSGRLNVTEIEHALHEFHTALQHDITFRDKVDICVMCAGKEIMSFRSGKEFQIPHIAENACSSLDSALDSAFDLIESRVAEYRLYGLIIARPLLYVISDGRTANCSPENHTKAHLQNLVSARKLIYVPVGIGNANVDALQSYYPTDAYAKPVLKPAAIGLKDAFFVLEDDLTLISPEDNWDDIDLSGLPSAITSLDIGPEAPTTVTIPLDDPNRVSPCIF